MKKLLIAIALLSLTKVSAANEFSLATSPYQTILSWFDQGEKLTFAELQRFRSGRCFVPHNTNTVLGSVLNFGEKKESDLGPGFPAGKVTKKMGIYLSLDETHYDTWVPKQGHKKHFLTHGDWDHYTAVSEEPTLNWLYDIENNNRVDNKFEVVKYSDYYVLKVTNLISQTLNYKGYENNPYVAKDAVIYACYYY